MLCYILPNSGFEADSQKVSLKILNLGIILKTSPMYAHLLLTISSLNGHLSLDRLTINQRTYDNLPYSAFETDFLWKVSLKILNSGIILKTIDHTYTEIFTCVASISAT